MNQDLVRTLEALANCQHPDSQRQHARVAMTGARFVRCTLCGAVAYHDDRYQRWTRAELVAHVVGAMSHG